MKPKLPKYIAFHRDLHLMVYRPQGVVNEPHIKDIIAALERFEESAQHPFNRYTDLSQIDAVDVRFEFIFRVSLHRRLTYSKHPPAKSAFYVTSPATAHLAKTHAILTDRSPLRVQLFTEIEAAAQWLGVSREDLEMAP